MISAPCAASTRARRTAASAVTQTLSRYHESGERLMTPMMAGAELKAKCFAPMENSHARVGFVAMPLQQFGEVFQFQHDSGKKMARPPRLERGTLCLEGRCSVQLSYGRSR